MNYELAKELKDAGFPQKGLWGVVYLPEKIHVAAGGQQFYRKEEYRTFPWKNATEFLTGGYEPIAQPTLSELIEACGQPFALEVGDHKGDTWFAWIPRVRAMDAGGATPEIAVARLWLALKAG